MRINVDFRKQEKICNKCKITKSINDFHKDATKEDKCHTYCKKCRGTKDKEFWPMCGIKRCTHCLEVKSEQDNFSIKNKKLFSTSSICKDCVRERSRTWYQNNKDRHNTTGNISRKKWSLKKRDYNKRLLIELKNKPCFDCGIQYDHWIMQFDHKDMFQKSGNLSTMAHNCKSREAILIEANKCDVVCANCHANRTHNRRNR